tara:strand:+ start:191 stop:325 length:135 start_codon:yes stop_codon:yes gene_type:complete
MSFFFDCCAEASADRRSVDRSDRAMARGLMGEPILYAGTGTDSE